MNIHLPTSTALAKTGWTRSQSIIDAAKAPKPHQTQLCRWTWAVALALSPQSEEEIPASPQPLRSAKSRTWPSAPQTHRRRIHAALLYDRAAHSTPHTHTQRNRCLHPNLAIATRSLSPERILSHYPKAPATRYSPLRYVSHNYSLKRHAALLAHLRMAMPLSYARLSTHEWSVPARSAPNFTTAEDFSTL